MIKMKISKFEFVARGARGLTRQINDVSTTINYYLFNLANFSNAKVHFQVRSVKYIFVK